ncbi:MAG: hypothetical protein QF415_12885 [Candidatus Undinarchaeales archaeon]|jgi:hypothetical protein|nr:hypothetical protein [Candidatus Undinarchaeales archaeon]MDP7494015.1 hypothetical protein [Candidatus Undinarchaeales archaeon]
MPGDGLDAYMDRDHCAVYNMLETDRELVHDIIEYSHVYDRAIKEHEHIDRTDLTRRIRDEYGWDQTKAESTLHDVLDLGALDMLGRLDGESVVERARYTQSLRPQLEDAYKDAVAYHASKGRQIPQDITVGIHIGNPREMINFDVMASYDPVDNRVRIKEKDAPFKGVEPNQDALFNWDRFSRDTLYRACLVHEFAHVNNDRTYDVNGEKNDVLDEGLAVYTTLEYCADMVKEGQEEFGLFAKNYVTRSLELTKKYALGTRVVAGILASEGKEGLEKAFKGDRNLEELAKEYRLLGEKVLADQLANIV